MGEHNGKANFYYQDSNEEWQKINDEPVSMTISLVEPGTVCYIDQIKIVPNE